MSTQDPRNLGIHDQTSTRSVGACLSFQSEQKPHAPAISCDGATLTFSQLEAQANRLARAYAELVPDGLFGRIVAIVLPNSVELVVSMFAVWKLGATPQVLPPLMPSAERNAILVLSTPGLLVGGSCAGCACVAPGFVAPEHLPDSPLPDCTPPHLKAPTSGGSSGTPKVILSAEPGEFDPAFAAQFGVCQPPAKTVLVPGPLFHNYPFMWTTVAIVTGRHLVLMGRFEPRDLLRLVEAHSVEYLALVPVFMVRPDPPPTCAALAHRRCHTVDVPSTCRCRLVSGSSDTPSGAAETCRA